MGSRFLEVFFKSIGSNPIGAAVTSPGHQRAGRRGRDCFPSAEVLKRSKAEAESRLCIHGLQASFTASSAQRSPPLQMGSFSSCKRWAGSS